MTCFISSNAKRTGIVFFIFLVVAVLGCVPASEYGQHTSKTIYQGNQDVQLDPTSASEATGIVYMPRHRCTHDGNWPVGACFVEAGTGATYWYHFDGQWKPRRPDTVSDDIAEPPEEWELKRNARSNR